MKPSLVDYFLLHWEWPLFVAAPAVLQHHGHGESTITIVINRSLLLYDQDSLQALGFAVS